MDVISVCSEIENFAIKYCFHIFAITVILVYKKQVFIDVNELYMMGSIY